VRTISSKLSAVLAISFGTIDFAVAKVMRSATIATMTAGSMVFTEALSMAMAFVGNVATVATVRSMS
jgi:hypothetical protein